MITVRNPSNINWKLVFAPMWLNDRILAVIKASTAGPRKSHVLESGFLGQTGSIESVMRHLPAIDSLSPALSTLCWILLVSLALSLCACSSQPVDIKTIDVTPLVAQGRLEEAAQEITRAMAEHPNHPGLLYNLAVIQHLQGQLDTALRTVERARQFAPQDDDILLLMVDLLLETGDPQKAWDVFHAMSETKKREARSQYTLGIINSRLGNWTNAENCFRAAAGLGESSGAALAALAFVTLKQGRLEEGKAYLLEAETVKNKSSETIRQIAESQLLIGQAASARDLARKLTELNPNDAGTWSLLGRAEMILLNFGEAESAFTRALNSANATPWTQVQYAEMLFAARREDEALAQATEAETRLMEQNTPLRNPALFNLLATLYAGNGQTLMAQKYLRQSLQIDSTQVKVRQLLQQLNLKVPAGHGPEDAAETSILESTPSSP